jgi:GH25 family lysozyme M1 (1,4-beta-N-acetylmuramidase)
MSDTIAYLKNHKLQLASEDEDPSNPGNVTAEVNAKVGMLWIDVEGTQYWSSNHANNVNFIQGMIDEAKSQKVNIGIYSSKSQWSPITGNSSKFSKYPLWYAHYDNKPNFSDFAPFGGWSKPAIKQYAGDVSLCSAGVDKNYY